MQRKSASCVLLALTHRAHRLDFKIDNFVACGLVDKCQGRNMTYISKSGQITNYKTGQLDLSLTAKFSLMFTGHRLTLEEAAMLLGDGGVSWTKFEHCMSKIRRILINFARAERVVTLSQIVRSDFVVMPTPPHLGRATSVVA